VQGRTAEVLDRGDGTVLKLFRSGFPPQAIDREAATAAAVSTCLQVRSPRLLGREDRQGRIGLVYERIEGPTQLAAMARSPLYVLRHAAAAAEVHARMHGAKPQGLPSQREAVARALERAGSLDPAIARTMIERVMSWPRGEALCHGDFHPDNILLSPDGPVVIDWMTATVGLPAVDVARTAVILRFSSPPPQMPAAARAAAAGLRSLYLRTYLRAYERASPGSLAGLGELMVPLAAARLAEGGSEDERKRLLAFVARHAGF
jgi:aminoglycoside phosphotransferase (APT) family kinase protein